MNARLLAAFSGVALAAWLAAGPAMADGVKWTGPGYYLLDNFDIFLVEGPFPTKADCEAAWSRIPQDFPKAVEGYQDMVSCAYMPSDPKFPAESG